MPHPVIQKMEQEQLKSKVPVFNVGDTVEVRCKIKEGDKERLQPFIGTVIGRQGGGVRETFTVRRLVEGEGVERVFPLHCPTLMEVRVRHKGEVRRAKLYYLRDRVGKATRIRGRTVFEVEGAQPAAEAAAKPAAGAKPAAQK